MANTKPFDAAAYLTDRRIIALYLVEAFKSRDVRLISKAIGTVARALVRKPRR